MRRPASPFAIRFEVSILRRDCGPVRPASSRPWTRRRWTRSWRAWSAPSIRAIERSSCQKRAFGSIRNIMRMTDFALSSIDCAEHGSCANAPTHAPPGRHGPAGMTAGECGNLYRVRASLASLFGGPPVPADPDDLAAALAFALKFEGRNVSMTRPRSWLTLSQRGSSDTWSAPATSS